MSKSKNKVVVFLAAVSLLAASGCLEHNITTTIGEDGSCERVIVVPADSFRVPATPYPLPLRAGWDTTWRPAPSGKGQALTVRKTFAAYDDLSSEYAVPQDSGHLRVSVSVARKFRWFYTYYSYREVFHRLTLFTRVPPGTVLSEDEITRYTQGERNAALNQKIEEWIARSLYETLFTRLRDAIVNLHDPDLPVERFEAKKEDVFRRLVKVSSDGLLRDFDSVLAEQTSYKGRSVVLFQGNTITENGLNAFTEVLADVMKSPRVTMLRDSAYAAWKEWADTIDRSAHLQGVFVNTVAMPGIVVRTNSPLIEGSTLIWKFDGEQYGLGDYVMEAESRVENLWAFGIAGAVAVVLAGLILFGRRRVG